MTMSKNPSVAIIGYGRIGRAVAYFLSRRQTIKSVGVIDPALKKNHPVLPRKVSRISSEKALAGYDLIIGCLPGDIGGGCLTLALKYRKNLIDISDVDPPGYLKKLKQIQRSGITVIPGCGFSPGLVNAIMGKEFSELKHLDSIEVKAGSLSPSGPCYPFLWCFEDIVLEHRIPSWQMVASRKRLVPAFAGFQPERFFGIPAESYYCASGFENLLDIYKPKNCIVRVVRPKGFYDFFRFMEGYGYLSGEKAEETKRFLESQRRDNITFAEITAHAPHRNIIWIIKAESRRNEPLNSMQKITASVPSAMAALLLKGMVPGKGLLFMDELGKDRDLFDALLSEVRRQGILVRKQ
jgi:saccharopine dehydrogenase-like NADP-dependent oxidoreductase